MSLEMIVMQKYPSYLKAKPYRYPEFMSERNARVKALVQSCNSSVGRTEVEARKLEAALYLPRIRVSRKSCATVWST